MPVYIGFSRSCKENPMLRCSIIYCRLRAGLDLPTEAWQVTRETHVLAGIGLYLMERKKLKSDHLKLGFLQGAFGIESFDW
jgi:hypothetical protein